MSSILKALKKVEGDGPEEAGPRPALRPASVPPPSRWSHWRERPPLLWGALAVTLVLAAAAVYHFVTPSEPTAPQAAAGAGRAVQARLPAAPAPPSGHTAPPPSSPPAPAPSSSPPALAVVPTEPPVEPTPPVQAPPPSARIRPRDAGPGAPSAPDTRSAPAQRAPSGQDRPTPVRPPAAPARSVEDSLNRLDDSKLKVMAIAWAEDPGRRLAVVNGHIVREGESVDGYTVTRIRRDDLVVSDGTRSWRVELNLRQQP